MRVDLLETDEDGSLPVEEGATLGIGDASAGSSSSLIGIASAFSSGCGASVKFGFDLSLPINMTCVLRTTKGQTLLPLRVAVPLLRLALTCYHKSV